MNHQERIQKSGYSIFEWTKNSDSNSTTPMDARYTALVLCTEGEASIESNMQEYQIRKGDCLCLGNVLYKNTISISDDFKSRVVICLSSFALGSVVGIPTGFMDSIYIKPIVNITDKNIWKLFNNHLGRCAA